MIRNYYTLKKVEESLQKLIGSRIIECFSQEKNSLVMNFYDGANEYLVQYYGNSQSGSLFLRDNFAKARKNTVDLFPAITDEVLQSVCLQSNDRIIVMKFIYTTIYFYVFGGSKSNVIITNQNDIIIDSFKSSKNLKNNKLELPEFLNNTDFPLDISIQKALAKSSYHLGPKYSRELLNRLRINPDEIVNSISDDKLDKIKEYVREFQTELLKSKIFYLIKNDEKLILSLIPLSNYPEIQDEYTDINQAILYRIIRSIKQDRFQSIYKHLSSKLYKQKERLENKIAQMKDEDTLIERSKKYKLWAELLYSQTQTKLTNVSSIKVKDYDENEIEIPLKEKLNLVENANKYYEKSHNSVEEVKIRKKLLPNLELQLLKINNTIEKLEKAQTIKELDKLQKNLKQLSGVYVQNENEETTKFREFDLGEGFILYVGKNAANNDELTMRFAKPNDLWFHARGSGGSHVVLRINKGQKPAKYIIKKAASIAAYYSQARKAKYTPVAYTFKKYVRKPKGANPGSVVMSKEEVIMVEPKLPV